jgi:hypothetical protein
VTLGKGSCGIKVQLNGAYRFVLLALFANPAHRGAVTPTGIRVKQDSIVAALIEHRTGKLPNFTVELVF